MKGFLIIAICIFIIFHIIGYHALIKQAIKTTKYRALSIFLLFINILTIIVFVYIRNTQVSDLVVRVMSVSILIACFLFVLGCLNTILILVNRFIHIPIHIISRILILIMFISIGVSIYQADKTPELIKQDIAIDGLKKDITIMLISDLHISNMIGVDKINRVIELSNSTQPDIVVLAGDILDSSEHVVTQKAQLLKKLKSKYGVYFILGNHEFIFDANKNLNIINNLGNINPLVNKNVIIDDNINLIGVSDLFGDKLGYLEPNLDTALNGIDTNLPKILISHQPNIIHRIDSNIDLVLSGHTHGGQIFPFTILTYLANPFLHGLREINGIKLYITQGSHLAVTYGRFWTKSEINLITLKGK